MNTSELVGEVARRTGLFTETAAKAVDAALRHVAVSLAEGRSPELPGIGRFEPAERAARTARNIRTGESVDVPATVSVVFRPAAEVRARIHRLVVDGREVPEHAPSRPSPNTKAAKATADAVAEACGLDRAVASKALEVMAEAVVEELESGGQVRLGAFGTFRKELRAARKGNRSFVPGMPDPVEIPARVHVVFRPGSMVRGRVAAPAV